MSREIKFRAWDTKNKWMDDEFFLHSSGRIYEGASRRYDTPHIEIEPANNLIVMQYTGLKDKNGVEIYELTEINKKYRVIFSLGCYVLQNISTGDIIGNLNSYLEGFPDAEVTREYAPMETH